MLLLQPSVCWNDVYMTTCQPPLNLLTSNDVYWKSINQDSPCSSLTHLSFRLITILHFIILFITHLSYYYRFVICDFIQWFIITFSIYTGIQIIPNLLQVVPFKLSLVQFSWVFITIIKLEIQIKVTVEYHLLEWLASKIIFKKWMYRNWNPCTLLIEMQNSGAIFKN